MKELKVYKMNDYEWYITPLSIEETIKWYNKEFDDDITENDIEEADLDAEGMWWETTDKKDINELGDSDEIIGIEKTPKGTRRKVRFGNLMRKEGLVYKYTSFREVIKNNYSESINRPEMIASTDW